MQKLHIWVILMQESSPWLPGAVLQTGCANTCLAVCMEQPPPATATCANASLAWPSSLFGQGLTEFAAFIHEAEVKMSFLDSAPAVLTSARCRYCTQVVLLLCYKPGASTAGKAANLNDDSNTLCWHPAPIRQCQE